ncbi:class I SAM-dependent methyltransferase [Streptomyces sp. NPDC005480]|uniref:class I SAM-dependent methyltransferase n=1 Tax=Streptomyces sp. NPDC005480 TaxID=3154880 RepID=UPI0033A16A75
MSVSSPFPASAPDWGNDPSAALEASSWALAALIGIIDDAITTPLAEVLAADPQRTAVLEAVGLVRRDGALLTPHPSLVYADGPTARSAVAARMSSLRQAVAVAAREPAATGRGWAGQTDEVLLAQGRASAATGRALANRVVPELTGLAARLGRPGGRILDVGTRVAALALAMADAFPDVEVVGIDVLRRVLGLARTELADAEPGTAARVSLRHEDVVALADRATYDLVWLPAPFLAEATLDAAVPRLTAALKPGGWLVVGTTPPAPDPLCQAVAGWNAVRGGGNSLDTDRMVEVLTGAGLRETRRFPTVPGGPVLVAAHHVGV